MNILNKFDDAMQIVCGECDTTNEQSEEKCENCPVRATYKRLLGIKTKDYEVIEVCPHCDEENVCPENMIEEENYIAVCQNCGRKIFLCDECLNADDNEEQDCDWHKGHEPSTKVSGLKNL